MKKSNVRFFNEDQNSAANVAFANLVSNSNIGTMPKSKSFITGTVVQKSKDGIYVDFGTKFDGFCEASEAGDLQKGDTADFWVLSPAEYEKSAVLSHTKYLAWKHIESLEGSGEVVSVRAFFVAEDKRKTRIAGLRVVFEEGVLKGIRGFVPFKEIADRKDVKGLLEQKLDVVVISSDPHRGPFGDLILSNAKAGLQAVRDSIAHVQAGDIVEGTVKKILNLEDGEKGVLVDLGENLTGIMYSRDITSVPGKSVTDLIKVGETRQFEIKRIDHKDCKIWLATKRLDRMNFEKQIAKDNEYTGKVVRSFDYGVFVHLGSEINGLVHISDLKRADVSLSVGDSVTVKVKTVDERCERISLTLVEKH